jgi:hypothetical protein
MVACRPKVSFDQMAAPVPEIIESSGILLNVFTVTGNMSRKTVHLFHIQIVFLLVTPYSLLSRY